MGKLLSGRYGEPPEATSTVNISLRECNEKLGLKPSDFVSEGAPKFFEKSYGSRQRYLLFLLEPSEVAGNVIWKPGYYLLPLEAVDVLRALDPIKKAPIGVGPQIPIQLRVKEPPPADVLERAQIWAKQSQPLFFKCKCGNLELSIDPPWALRRRWRARLRCPERCQPALSTAL